MSNYTPGPWKINRSLGFIANDERRTVVCWIPAPASSPLVEEDARLIAAAPELLEACRAALELSEIENSLTSKVENLLRAAVTKAEGGP